MLCVFTKVNPRNLTPTFPFHQIETRYATGEVKGKYGYIDPTGALREVEYGATPGRGFEPRAEGLVVAPPTLADEGRNKFNSLSDLGIFFKWTSLFGEHKKFS